MHQILIISLKLAVSISTVIGVLMVNMAAIQPDSCWLLLLVGAMQMAAIINAAVWDVDFLLFAGAWIFGYPVIDGLSRWMS